MAGFRGTGVTINAKGVEELSAMATVPSTGWFVVARLPTTEAFRTVEVLRAYILRNSLVVLGVMLVVLVLVLPQLFRPLTEAAQAMRRMANGEVELHPLPVKRRDEVGDLVAGFNCLVEALREKEVALKASQVRLDFMAHHDPLTGLPNRALLEDRLDQALARAERDGSQLALLFCDLDGFKPINDEHGHAVGDAVLREVAQRLTEGRRRVDTVVRLGGDEFVILVTGLEDGRSAARAVAEQCLTAIAEPFEVAGKALKLGISIGIAVHQGPAVGAHHLLSQADAAMYLAKQSGKGRLAFHEQAPGAPAD
jgi:diguanylate cyclase (GGDEF)-like protein